jgi:uncharacterized protein YndB with AHSA1/START domain
MNNRTGSTTAAAETHTVIIEREYDAPRDLVFSAWVDPQHVARWWGLHSYTNDVRALDVRPGGAMHIDMRAPNGAVFPMVGVYDEVLEPERLVFTATLFDDKGEMFMEDVTTVTFSEHNGRTKVVVEARLVQAARDNAAVGLERGWGQSLERLAKDLTTA